MSKCYCREEIIVSDCVPAKAIARIISNISIRCPNSQNGCQWNCDSALDSVVRQNHVTDCRWGYDTWKFTYSNHVAFPQVTKTLNSFRFSESPKIKQLKEERKFHLDRSRSLHLQNIKLRKQIETIKKEAQVALFEPIPSSQPKITMYFAKKSRPIEEIIK